MILTTDFHSHIVRSSAIQMAQAAEKKGLRILGLSEHVFQMEEARTPLQHMPLEGATLTLAQYNTAVRDANKESPVDIRMGLEVDFLPGSNEIISTSIQNYPWDYLIGSVHQVDGRLFERENPPSRSEGEQRWSKYFQLLREAVNSGYFDVVSHPVRMRSENAYVPASLDDELEHLAAEATRCNVALEINGYDMRGYPSLVRRLAQACKAQYTPISVGSDAHTPSQVAQAHRATEHLLRDVGIASVRIWKQRIAQEYEL